MDVGMYELVEKILHGVSFIAIGGTLALIFFFVFAPSILGSKTIQQQLENLHQQAKAMNEQLRKIAERFENKEQKAE